MFPHWYSSKTSKEVLINKSLSGANSFFPSFLYVIEPSALSCSKTLNTVAFAASWKRYKDCLSF